MNLLQAEKLHVELDGFTVLEDVSFSLAKGEIVGLSVQRSGKTTLLENADRSFFKPARGACRDPRETGPDFSTQELAAATGYLPRRARFTGRLLRTYRGARACAFF